jgi:hypothetical protein
VRPEGLVKFKNSPTRRESNPRPFCLQDIALGSAVFLYGSGDGLSGGLVLLFSTLEVIAGVADVGCWVPLPTLSFQLMVKQEQL